MQAFQRAAAAWMAVWVAALVACSSGDPEVIQTHVQATAPAQWDTYSSAPSLGVALATEELMAPDALEAWGRPGGDGTGSTTLVVVAGGHVFEVSGGTLHGRTLYAAPGDPDTLGQVAAVRPRQAGGVWLAGDQGLFMLEGDYVSKSPLEVGMGALSAVSERSGGVLAGLWLGAQDGLYRRQSTRFDRLNIANAPPVVRHVAVDRAGTLAVAVCDQALFALQVTENQLHSTATALEPGVVHGVAGGDGFVVVASDLGLLRLKATAPLRWEQFTLAEQGTDAVEVLAVQVDDEGTRVWARTQTTVVLLHNEQLTGHSVPAAAGAGSMLAVDTHGDVWTAQGSVLTRHVASDGMAVPTFANDVTPWLSTHCTRCHADFTTYSVFAPRASLALQRVSNGDMPRCEGGVVCPTQQRLTAEQYDVLDRWISGGRLP